MKGKRAPPSGPRHVRGGGVQTSTSGSNRHKKKNRYEIGPKHHHPTISRVKKHVAVQSQAVRSVAQRPVVVRAVSLHVDPTHALARLRPSGRLLLFAVRAAVCVAAARGLQQGVVGQRQGLVEQGVQSLLVDPGFWKLHLREGQVADQRAARCQCFDLR